MPVQPEPRSAITLPNARLRRLAKRLSDLTQSSETIRDEEPPVKVVCISDTHNHQPELPPGDLLIHAGDLTEWGSFDEVQQQLSWLSSQPHKYKVVIAGNHDILFDQQFLDSDYGRRFPTQAGRAAADLDFGSVIYLQDSATTLDFTETGRRLTIYGSPWTPQYVKSAFQYPRDQDIWAEKLPHKLDILVTHGPPFGHLDGPFRSGCPYLTEAIEERRPRLVVFGHIHVGYGREVVKIDRLRKLYEAIERKWSGWEVVPLMIFILIWSWLCIGVRFLVGRPRDGRLTELVNAAIVGEGKIPCNEPTVVYI